MSSFIPGVFILYSVFFMPAQGATDCHYYYITQPGEDDTCNPWPLVTADNINSSATLTLHCNIMATRSGPLPNVEWFRLVLGDDTGSPQRIFPGDSDNKYTGPMSTQDVSNSFKMVNFSLVVHNVNDKDVGCYFCRLNVCSAGTSCCFDVRPSSQFCLLQQTNYNDKESCLSIAVNLSSVCASSNRSCDLELGLYTDQPSLTAMESVPSPTSSITMATDLSLSLSTRIDSMSRLTQVDSSSLSPLNNDRVIVSKSSVNSYSKLTALNSELSTSPGLDVKATPLPSQLNLRMGLYIVVGVCSMLLVVILILLAIVAILCRKKPLQSGVKKRQDGNTRRSAPLSHRSSGQLDSKKRARPNSKEISTNIEEENMLRILSVQPLSSPPTISEDSSSSNDWSKRSQDESSSEWMSSGCGPQPPAGSPSVLMAGIQEACEGHTEETTTNHKILPTNEERENSHMTTKHDGYLTDRHSSSPESHYYHVLEGPQYNNNFTEHGHKLPLKEQADERSHSNDYGNEDLERESEPTISQSKKQYNCFSKVKNLDISNTRPQVFNNSKKEGYDWAMSVLPTITDCKHEKPNTTYASIDLSLLDQTSEYTQVNLSTPQRRD